MFKDIAPGIYEAKCYNLKKNIKHNVYVLINYNKIVFMSMCVYLKFYKKCSIIISVIGKVTQTTLIINKNESAVISCLLDKFQFP